MPNAEEWGKGYDFGQMGMMKAIKTAEELGAYRERERIIKLLEEEFNDTWPTGIAFVETSLPNLIALIKGENK